MSADNKVPAIRFEGVSGEWEEKELGEVTSYTKGYAFKSSNYEHSGVRIIRVSDLMKDSLSETSDKIYINSSKEYIYSKYKINTGDIVITTVGSKAYMRDSAVGRAIIFNTSKGYLLNQNLVKISSLPSNNCHFIHAQLSRESYAKYIEDIERGNANQANITITDLWKYRLSIPDNAEQTKIGNTFQQLDTLIAQHQQKHDKLLNIKQSLLEKCFPQHGQTEPAIRFKGFSVEWKDKVFSDCFVNIPSNTLSRADMNYEKGLAKNVHYGDVLIKFGEVLDVKKETLPFITDSKWAVKLKSGLLKDGDVIIADAAEDETVGKCTEIFNIEDQTVYSGLHTIAIRPVLLFSSKYLGYYLNSTTYHDQLLKLMQGTKVLSISKTTIQNTSVAFPNDLKEQTKIGQLFKQLDTLTSQHQAQLTKLNNIKQACLEKIFV